MAILQYNCMSCGQNWPSTKKKKIKLKKQISSPHHQVERRELWWKAGSPSFSEAMHTCPIREVNSVVYTKTYRTSLDCRPHLQTDVLSMLFYTHICIYIYIYIYNYISDRRSNGPHKTQGFLTTPSQSHDVQWCSNMQTKICLEVCQSYRPFAGSIHIISRAMVLTTPSHSFD